MYKRASKQLRNVWKDGSCVRRNGHSAPNCKYSSHVRSIYTGAEGKYAPWGQLPLLDFEKNIYYHMM